MTVVILSFSLIHFLGQAIGIPEVIKTETHLTSAYPAGRPGFLRLVTGPNAPRVDPVKAFFSAVFIWLVWLPSAAAQVLVELKFDQEHYLPGEAVPVTARIINRSGQTLRLGGEADWLTFSVESRDSFIVNKNGDAPVFGEFLLETSKVGVKRVDLAPYFALTRPGRYRITATVRIKDWAAQTTSTPKDFSIVDGAKIWTREFGVPAGEGANQPPELRRYTLLQATLRTEIRLYFRLSDGAEAKLIKVFPLGQMVSFGRPEAQLDGQNRLHVLHQNGAHSSLYSVITPDGELIKRQLYDFVETRTRLQLDREGNISVAGGARRLTRADVPAEPDPEPEPEAKPELEPKPTSSGVEPPK